MFVFGHAGITLGVARLIDAFTCSKILLKEEPHHSSSPDGSLSNFASKYRPKSLLPLGRWLDYRPVAFSGLFPDVADKLIGNIIFAESISYGRIYAHTLLFSIVLGLLGWWLFKRTGRGWLLVLSFGSFLHILEDQIWLEPEVLWWPLYGFTFPREDLGPFVDWLFKVFQVVLTNPSVYIPEILGIVVFLIISVEVVLRRKVKRALKTGHIT